MNHHLFISDPCIPGRTVLKRVVGMPGDHIIAAAQLPTRGTGSSSSTDPSNPLQSIPLLRLNPGFCWLEGDDPLDTADSRRYGPVRHFHELIHDTQLGVYQV